MCSTTMCMVTHAMCMVVVVMLSASLLVVARSCRVTQQRTIEESAEQGNAVGTLKMLEHYRGNIQLQSTIKSKPDEGGGKGWESLVNQSVCVLSRLLAIPTARLYRRSPSLVQAFGSGLRLGTQILVSEASQSHCRFHAARCSGCCLLEICETTVLLQCCV